MHDVTTFTQINNRIQTLDENILPSGWPTAESYSCFCRFLTLSIRYLTAYCLLQSSWEPPVISASWAIKGMQQILGKCWENIMWQPHLHCKNWSRFLNISKFTLILFHQQINSLSSLNWGKYPYFEINWPFFYLNFSSVLKVSHKQI